MNRIPVTILTGFLGSGKTTLLNQLMQSKTDENVVIIINEFGDTGIDHELVLNNTDERIYQMNNGCMCCILRDDLAEMFSAILSAVAAKDITVNRIIIETSGLAEPSPIAQTIVRIPMLSEHLVVDSILTLVDAENALHQLRHYHESVEQIAFADRVLLSKTDQVDGLTSQLVRKAVREINPFIEIVDLDIDKVHYHDIVGLDLFDHSVGSVHGIEEGIDAMISQEHDHHDHHHSDIDAFSIVINEPLDERAAALWLNTLVTQYGMDLLRYKGILNIKGKSHQVIIQGINMAYRTDHGKQWGQNRQTKFVIIGKNLPESLIRDSLTSHDGTNDQ